MNTHSGFRFLFFAASVLTSSSSQSAPFTAGNLVVVRIGTGLAPLTNASTEVFLDEFTTSRGTAVQSIALSTAANGAHQPLTAAGTAVSEALITRSTD